MAEIRVSPEETATALASVGPDASTEEIVAALQGAASMAVLEFEIAQERAFAEVVAEFQEGINELRAGLESDRRAKAKPEVDRYIAMQRRRR